MKTRRLSKPDAHPEPRQESKPEVKQTTVPTVPVEEKDAVEPQYPQGFRVALTPEGDVDLERMNPKSIEKLRIAVNSPAVQKNILKAPATEPEKREPVLPEFVVNKMYDAVSMLEVAVATRFFGVDSGVAERVLPFNEKEKSFLVPSTAAVIDKHSGEWFRKYKEEAVLISMLVTTISAKIVQLRFQLALLEEQKRARVPASPPPQPVAPAPAVEGTPNGAAA
jgi:hypothetical protein